MVGHSLLLLSPERMTHPQRDQSTPISLRLSVAPCGPAQSPSSQSSPVLWDPSPTHVAGEASLPPLRCDDHACTSPTSLPLYGDVPEGAGQAMQYSLQKLPSLPTRGDTNAAQDGHVFLNLSTSPAHRHVHRLTHILRVSRVHMGPI